MKELVVPIYCINGIVGYVTMLIGLGLVGKLQWAPFVWGAFIPIYMIGFLIACLVKNITP